MQRYSRTATVVLASMLLVLLASILVLLWSTFNKSIYAQNGTIPEPEISWVDVTFYRYVDLNENGYRDPDELPYLDAQDAEELFWVWNVLACGTSDYTDGWQPIGPDTHVKTVVEGCLYVVQHRMIDYSTGLTCTVGNFIAEEGLVLYVSTLCDGDNLYGTPTPNATPTATGTATATPSATFTATATPDPDATPTATPTPLAPSIYLPIMKGQ